PLGPVIPAGSLLAKWQGSGSAEEKIKLAENVQQLLTSGAPAQKDSPDAALYHQLTSLGGPLFGGMGSTGYQPVPPVDSPDGTGGTIRDSRNAASTKEPLPIPVGKLQTGTGGSPVPPIRWGLDPARFG